MKCSLFAAFVAALTVGFLFADELADATSAVLHANRKGAVHGAAPLPAATPSSGAPFLRAVPAAGSGSTADCNPPGKLLLAIGIITAPGHFDRRVWIRQKLRVSEARCRGVKVLFVLGNRNRMTNAVKLAVTHEHRMHGDILFVGMSILSKAFSMDITMYLWFPLLSVKGLA